MAKPTSPFPLLLLLLLLLPASTLQAAQTPSASPSVQLHRKLEGRFRSLFSGSFLPKIFKIPVGGSSGGEDAAPTPVGPPPPPAGGRPHRHRGKIAREFLDAHNRVRAAEGEAPLAWNRGLARFANRWAQQRRGDCANVHSGGPYGENMFSGTGQGWTAAVAVEIWAKEVDYYDRENNTCEEGKMCGHYTQIVWNNTMRVGCARAECFDGGVIIICNYDPPGNWVDERPFNDDP